MSDGDALLRAILAEPDEDTPRLALADWLDEQGRPARAEFIRAQVELARTPERDVVPWNPRVVTLRACEKGLYEAHLRAWLEDLRAAGGPLEALGTNVQFRRGFVEIGWMTAAWFVDHAAELFRRVPLRELRVTFSSPPSFVDLLDSPHLPRLDTLDLSGRALGDGGVERVSRTRAVGRLRGLRLRGCELTDVAACRLADVDFAWEPRELDVSFNPLGPAGLTALRDRFGGAVRFDRR